MTKATPQVVIKQPQRRSVFTAVIPGRRALGETWNRIDVYWNDDIRGWDLELTPTDTPADNRGILIPAAMTADNEMLDFILGQKMKDAEYRAAHPDKERSPEEEIALVNHWWQDYCEWKRRSIAGESTYGPGLSAQRQKVDRHG